MLSSQAVAEEHEINEEHRRGTNVLQKLHTRFKTLEQKVHDLEAQHVQNTQVLMWWYSIVFTHGLHFLCSDAFLHCIMFQPYTVILAAHKGFRTLSHPHFLVAS